MKILVLIWSIYILALSVMPCTDARNECYNTTISQIGLTENHSHTQDANDNCSPFCVCTCCNTITINLDCLPIQIHHFIHTAVKKITTYFISEKIRIRRFCFLSNYFDNIWRPPKI